MRNIQELYKVLIDDKKFFKENKDFFKEKFLKEFSKSEKIDPDKEKLLEALVERIYNLIFSFEEDAVLEKLYTVILKTLEEEINIKPVLSKTLLVFLKRYIDYILETGRNINYIKAFVSLIEEYTLIVDKAYVDYIEKLKKEIKEVKENKRKEEIKTILVLLRNIKKHKQKIEILSYYNEVAIKCKGTLRDVSVHTISLDISDCIKKTFRKDRHVFLKVGHKTKVLKGRIKGVNPYEGVLILDDLELIELPQEKRRYLRVRLSKKPKTVLKVENKFIEGIIDDISIGGAGIYIENPDRLEKGNVIEVKLPVKGRNLILESEVIHISKKGHLYKIGIQFLNLFQKDENFLGEFITERQFEILKEIRE